MKAKIKANGLPEDSQVQIDIGKLYRALSMVDDSETWMLKGGEMCRTDPECDLNRMKELYEELFMLFEYTGGWKKRDVSVGELEGIQEKGAGFFARAADLHRHVHISAGAISCLLTPPP